MGNAPALGRKMASAKHDNTCNSIICVHLINLNDDIFYMLNKNLLAGKCANLQPIHSIRIYIAIIGSFRHLYFNSNLSEFHMKSQLKTLHRHC